MSPERYTNQEVEKFVPKTPRCNIIPSYLQPETHASNPNIKKRRPFATLEADACLMTTPRRKIQRQAFASALCEFGYACDNANAPNSTLPLVSMLNPPITPPVRAPSSQPGHHTPVSTPTRNNLISRCNPICYGFFCPVRSPKVSPQFPSCLSRDSKLSQSRLTEKITHQSARPDDAALRQILDDSIAAGCVRLVSSE